MLAVAVALTILLLLETLPSAIAGLLRARAGLARLASGADRSVRISCSSRWQWLS